MRYNDRIKEGLIQLMVLYDPKKKGFLSKNMMSYQDKKKFIGVFQPNPDSKLQIVGLEPESLAGALASIYVLAKNEPGDHDNMSIRIHDINNDTIIGFYRMDGEFAVIVGDKYTSKKETSTFKII